MGNKNEIDVVLVRKPMVNWFAPGQLALTGVRAVLGALFGAYADKREVQAALDEDTTPLPSYASEDTLWIDYVADLGDGWDSTYSLAWLLSRDTLKLGDEVTPRGHMLVMGGDQVYPTATREEYRNRLTKPYQAALPWRDEDQRPDLYVVPGNHDWYDGLSNYIKLFCQQRDFGAWKTRQSRSYFVLQLPHHWWLWSVDIQLEADIDDPQKKYFEAYAKLLQPGDRVLLCTAVPSWVEAGDSRHEPDAAADTPQPNLDLLQSLIDKAGAEVSVTVAGDAHHYAHYVQAPVSDGSARHKFTAGGGGAYMLGTRHLPKTLELTEKRQATQYELADTTFPDADESYRQVRGNFRFVRHNKGFSLAVALIYLFYAWIWQSASKVNGVDAFGKPLTSLMELLADLPLSFHSLLQIHVYFYQVLRHHPGAVFLSLIIPIGCYFFTAPPPGGGKLSKPIWGLIHGFGHLFTGQGLLWLFSAINIRLLMPECFDGNVVAWLDSPLQVLLFTLELLFSGFFIGGTVTGLYLWASNRISGMHYNDAFSALHSADFKNFLRIKLDKSGLTIYSVGIEKACTKWKLAAHTQAQRSTSRRPLWQFKVDKTDTRAWVEPASGSIPVKLLETTRIKPRA